MNKKRRLAFDEIGYWSEIKLDIVKDYASAYSRIFSAEKQSRFSHVYIDGFAGPGVHLSKTTGNFVPGSPLNALAVTPPFKEYFLIDLDGDKIDGLRSIIGERSNVHLHHGDCNDILLNEVFPKVRYEDYRRGLCLLDPYGLHLDWEIIQTAGTMRTLDVFLNFPIMDMNRNALWRKPEAVGEDGIRRMTEFWGDETWRDVAYESVPTLFGDEDEKTSNETIATGFRERLKKVAGFGHVPAPLPMRNTTGATVYYLFFASQNTAANKIVKDIFAKYAERGA